MCCRGPISHVAGRTLPCRQDKMPLPPVSAAFLPLNGSLRSPLERQKNACAPSPHRGPHHAIARISGVRPSTFNLTCALSAAGPLAGPAGAVGAAAIADAKSKIAEMAQNNSRRVVAESIGIVLLLLRRRDFAANQQYMYCNRNYSICTREPHRPAPREAPPPRERKSS